MAGHDGYTRYTVRIPTPLYERVKAAAGEKSVNAEIVGVLEEAYPADDFVDQATSAVIKFITSKVPREVFVEDFEQRIRQIILEHAEIGSPATKLSGEGFVEKGYDQKLPQGLGPAPSPDDRAAPESHGLGEPPKRHPRRPGPFPKDD